MRRYALLTLAALLVVLAGCGGGASVASQSAPAADEGTATQPATGSTRTTVYFLIDNGAAPIGVRRTIRTKSPYARRALEALLAGPSDEERGAGVTTALPAATRLLSLAFRATTAPGGNEAVVDLSGLEGVRDSMRTARIVTQVARTLIGLSDIDRVTFRSNGQPWGLVLRDGEVVDGPFDYRRLAFDIGYGCPGTETVVCDRFVGLP
jgi:spore germination protein GerM